MEIGFEEWRTTAKTNAIRARRVGSSAVRFTGGLVSDGINSVSTGVKSFVDLFARPEVATRLVDQSLEEQRSMPALVAELELHVGNRLERQKIARKICAETVAILSKPEEQRSEDDILDLKSAAYIFGNDPGTMIGVNELLPEEVQLLSNFMATAQMKRS